MSETQPGKARYGYCALTADFIHIGHIRFIRACSLQCDKLIVGIMSDEVVEKYKGKRPILNQIERNEIISNIKNVHMTVIQTTFEYPEHVLSMKKFWKENFIIFDSQEHKRKYADVLIERTENISSTIFKRIVNESSDYRQCSL